MNQKSAVCKSVSNMRSVLNTPVVYPQPFASTVNYAPNALEACVLYAWMVTIEKSKCNRCITDTSKVHGLNQEHVLKSGYIELSKRCTWNITNKVTNK